MIETITKPTELAEKIINEIIKKEGKIKFPIDPFKILKEYNTIITFSDFDKLEGLLLYDEKNSFVSINSNRPVQRQRFTAAHELGHIVMHTKIKGDNFFCPIGNVKNVIEKEADEFASNLLMPTYELLNQIKKYEDENGKIGLEECLLISEYFGVSFEACVKTVSFRLQKFKDNLNNKELTSLIKKFKPSKKRKELLKNTNDLKLLINAISYSHFTIINTSDIIGIKFIQDLVYHESRLEKVNISMEDINKIFADFRINGSNSKYCTEQNKEIIETLGNIELNEYCLQTMDDISIFKIKDLNKILYRYVPYPEYTGYFRTDNNIILNGAIQPTNVTLLIEKLEEIDILVNEIIENIDKYSIEEYIYEICNIHYKLTVLHPFNDGNGRISRAFLNWLLRLKKLPPIYIDSENRDEYLEALKNIDIYNDSNQLQLIVVKGIINTMTLLHKNWDN